MALFNDNFKKISIKEFLVVLILLYLCEYIVDSFYPIDSNLINIFVIFYFVWKFKDCFSPFKVEISSVFSKVSFRYILFIVLANIFFSYGMLYFADFLLKNFSFVDYIVNLSFISKSLLASLGGALTVIVISPISEELIFRGMFLNKLKLIVPTIFAVLISSLLFGVLHTYGGMISAFVFAVCMAIIYLKSENILTAIFAHFLNNVIAETISFLDSGNILFTDHLVMGFVSILAFISFVLILIFIFRELNNFK